MKLVIQLVKSASVTIENKLVGSIQSGLLVFVGFTHADTRDNVNSLTEKLLNLRIFSDDKGKMNLSIKDVHGELLVVSQFTLYGNCRKGNRPSFITAARPEQANELYDYFVTKCKAYGLNVATGEFGSYMCVSLVNDGPVTILLEA